MNNTFTSFLELLKVRHSRSFSEQYFNEHPHKNNLYGLSKMLSDYGIRNAATQIEDKENDLFNIACPFVAYMGGDFVVVNNVETRHTLSSTGETGETGEIGETGKVHFVRNGKKIVIPVSQFIRSWSGIALLAEPSPDSCEPEYKAHRKKDLLTIAQKSILALACTLLLGITYFTTHISPISPISPTSPTSPISPISPILSISPTPLGSSLLLLVNLVGIYICYLLVLKQLHIQSRYADKICTLFSQSDCNNVLESDAAKLFGMFGWSEIGLGYFAANTIILLFLPHLLPSLVLINILALPFTFWSVWYQKVKARQWCLLCLIVLVLLWTIFIINSVFGYTQQIVIAGLDPHSQFSTLNCFPSESQTLYIFNIIVKSQLIIAVCFYTIPIFTLNLLLPKLAEGHQTTQLRQEINGIKANDNIFKTLLAQQPFYEVSKTDSHILFGNPDAQLKITILTNPFCNPCAKMHARVEKLLQETKGEVCVQYIYSSFNESLDYANKYMIALYLNPPHSDGLIPHWRGQGEAAWQLYSTWFTKGKALKEAFFEKLQLDINDPAVEVEFQKHESWKAKTQLRATPTILVNGCKLPENYKIEDLRYFMEFDVNIK